MKEQKFLITSNIKADAMHEVNSILEEGWLIITMIPAFSCHSQLVELCSCH